MSHAVPDPLPPQPGRCLCRWLNWLFAPEKARAHWLVFVAILTASLTLQWKVGQGFALQTNLDMNASDQLACLRLVERNAPAPWPMMIDGTRNPLFPWLLKPWHTADREQLFVTAKSVNIAFGMIASVVLGCYFLRRLPLLPAVVLMLLGTYAVILPISTYVGAEVVFYTAFFFLWVFYWKMLTSVRWQTYALGGLICALAYLAKPSTQLLTFVFGLLSLVRFRDSLSLAKVRRLLLCGSVFLVCFLLPVLPRAWFAWQQYGDPFQSCSAYCFWTENWDEAQPDLGYYTPRQINELPEDRRPSPANYWRHHTCGQIFARLLNGVPVQAQNFFLPEKTLKLNRKPSESIRLLVGFRGAYPFTLLCLTLLLALATRGALEAPEERRSRRMFWWLSGLTFVLHFLAFAFYVPITPGARFIMATYLPVTFALALGLESLRKHLPPGRPETLYRLSYLAMATGLLMSLLPLIHGTTFGEIRGAF